MACIARMTHPAKPLLRLRVAPSVCRCRFNVACRPGLGSNRVTTYRPKRKSTGVDTPYSHRRHRAESVKSVQASRNDSNHERVRRVLVNPSLIEDVHHDATRSDGTVLFHVKHMRRSKVGETFRSLLPSPQPRSGTERARRVVPGGQPGCVLPTQAGLSRLLEVHPNRYHASTLETTGRSRATPLPIRVSCHQH
jgi:hypothetical protein